MATIGNLALQLTADPAQFVGAMAQATRSLNAFSRSAANPNTWLRGINSGFSSLGGAVSSAIRPLQTLVSSIPLVGGALGGLLGSLFSVHGIFELYKEGASRVNTINLAARKLGVSVEYLSAVANNGIVPVDTFVSMMGRLEKLIGAAASSKGGALGIGGDELGRLQLAGDALGRLGLSGAQLARVGLGEALGQVADKIKGLDNAALQAKAAFDLFGRGGLEMVPLLKLGSSGIDAMAEKMKRLGLSFSQVDAEQVKQATVAIRDLERWIAAVKQQVAIKLAPVVLALAEQFGEVGLKAEDVADAVLTSFKVIAKGFATLVEIGRGIKMLWDVAKIGILGLAASVASAIQKLMEQASKLPDIMGGGQFREAAEFMAGRAEDLWGQNQKAQDEFWASMSQKSAWRAVDDFFDGVLTKTDRLRKDLEKSAKTAGELNDAARLFELFDKAQALEKELESPLTKFYSKLSEINELVTAGAISWDTYGLALTKAFDELEKGQAKVEVKAPTAVEAGSKEAYSRIAEAQRQSTGAANVQDRIEKLLREAAARQEQQIQVGRQTVQAIYDIFRRGI